MQPIIQTALIAAAASTVVALIGYWVQNSKTKQEFDHDVAQVKSAFMAEAAARAILTQYPAPFRTFIIIRHHIGGFEDDELRRILVRAGALRFMSKSGMELWALRERVIHYKASWETEAKNFLSVWKLPVDPTSPRAEELFPARLTSSAVDDPTEEGLFEKKATSS